jgi:hypothetical protein
VMRVDCNMLGGPEKEEKEAFSWMSNAHLTSPEELSVRPMGHLLSYNANELFPMWNTILSQRVCLSLFLWQQCWLFCQRLSHCYGYSKQGFWTTTADTQ